MTGIILSSSSNRGPGHVLLTCDDFCELSSTTQWQVRRIGVNASYLGANGWQITPYCHTFELIGSDQFLMGPNLVRYMEPLTNYIFEVIEHGETGANYVVSWRGVPSYRPGIDNPIFFPVEENSDLIKPVSLGEEADAFTISVSSQINQANPIPPVETANISEQGSVFLAAPPFDMRVSEPVISPPLQSQPEPKQRNKILCPNVDCAKEIISTFIKCPWCNFELANGASK